MTTARIRLALVGAGIIARQHARVISQLADRVELAAVVDPDPAKAAELAEQFGAATYGTLAEAVAAADFSVVVVCTPTGTHADVAIEALEAGKNVVIEKPAEVSLERTDAIIAAQEAAGTLVAVISQHRFDPSTELLVGAIERGELGRLTSGIASIDWWRGQSYYDSGDWRGTWALDGGGALMNQGVHTVDLLVAALGTPVEVFGYTATLAHDRIEVEDVAAAVVKFESGAIGVLHGSTAVYPGLVARLQIHGDKGSAVIENDRLTYIHTTPAGESVEEAFMGNTGRSTNQIDQHEFPADFFSAPGAAGLMSNAHKHQYLDFLDALESGGEVRIGLHENRLAISIITGVYESARTGLPVRLV
jgi:UDP-N-acetyl-2-amino-2-deoxyglucuronate dehydrogenase